MLPLGSLEYKVEPDGTKKLDGRKLTFYLKTGEISIDFFINNK